MAASSQDSDYVHLLKKSIQGKSSLTTVKFFNIRDFEAGYKNYSLSRFDSLKYPDVLILRIGENVDDKTAKKMVLSNTMQRLFIYIV